MPWERPKETNSSKGPADGTARNSTSTNGGASADALFMLNALFSATTAAPANEATSSNNFASGDLSNLLDTLADFSSRVNSLADTGDGNEHSNSGEQARQNNAAGPSNSSDAADVASLLLSSIANATANVDSTKATDDYEKYERERELKYRELEAKFSFLNPKKPAVVQKEKPRIVASSPQRPPPIVQQRLNQQPEVAVSSMNNILASSVMTELISTLKRQQMENNATASVSRIVPTKPQKTTNQKRRHVSSGSESSSRSRSSSSSYSSTDSDRHAKTKRSKVERKEVKKQKSKKIKHKEAKRPSSSKQLKPKKEQASAKKKAMERISKLKSDLASVSKRRKMLEDEISRLKKQYNEMCRKLQRQKSDPKKDPLIVENESLQGDIEALVQCLDKEKDAIERELEAENKRFHKLQEHGKAKKKETDEKIKAKRQSDSPTRPAKLQNIEYFDPGSHWCKLCNTVVANIYELLEHLHSQKHKSHMDLLDRPWMPERVDVPVKKEGAASLKPFKGIEFLMPSTAFYCTLCNEFSGDSYSAETHLKSETHNAKYQAYLETNPFYERREMLEKAAAMSQQIDRNTSKASVTAGSQLFPPSGGRTNPPPSMVPHKPNESGKIKPFRLSITSSGQEKRPAGSSRNMEPNKASSTTNTSLKRPHSAFMDDQSPHKARKEEIDKSARYGNDDRSKHDRRGGSSSDRRHHHHR